MYYISPYALYKLVKQLFHDVNDVNDMTLYAYRENKCWKIGFSNEYIDQIPDDQIDQVEVPNGKPILYEFDPALNITKKTFITMDGEENGNS